MKLILLASCASALVVPPLAQRRRDLPVAKGFYDEDDEHDEAPRPWEVGGVRLERLVIGKYFSSAYGRVAAARVARAASLATTLPRIFDLSFKAISTIVLASFLLVDLGSPQFEAILFAVLACSFYLLESFVDDLEDPFGGSWTVDAALDACDELVDALAVEE